MVFRFVPTIGPHFYINLGARCVWVARRASFTPNTHEESSIMNIYRTVINRLGLSPDSHCENGWLYSLLKMGESLNISTAGNPFRLVVQSLEQQGISPPTLERVKQLLNASAEAEDKRGA